MNFKLILSLICCINLYFCSSPLHAQRNQDENDSNSFRKKISFNISGGFNFGSVTNINVSPQIGYRITPKLISGIGLNLQYFNFVGSPQAYFLYGGNAFTRYHINPRLFIQGEYQVLNFQENWTEYVLAGGGYVDPAGIYISAYYIVQQPSTGSIYGTAPYVIRAGIFF